MPQTAWRGGAQSNNQDSKQCTVDCTHIEFWRQHRRHIHRLPFCVHQQRCQPHGGALTPRRCTLRAAAHGQARQRYAAVAIGLQAAAQARLGEHEQRRLAKRQHAAPQSPVLGFHSHGQSGRQHADAASLPVGK